MCVGVNLLTRYTGVFGSFLRVGDEGAFSVSVSAKTYQNASYQWRNVASVTLFFHSDYVSDDSVVGLLATRE